MPKEKPFSWSYSKLRDWETCPRMFAAKHITREFRDDGNEKTQWGEKVHDALEQRAGGTPLPEVMKPLERLGTAIDQAKAAGIRIFADKQSGKWAFDRNLTIVEWFAPNAYGRVIVDLALIGRQHGILIDYKTGKRRDDPTQLKISAGVGFAKFPELRTIETRYVWTQGGDPTVKSYSRDDAPWIWHDILPRVDRMETGIELKQFDPQPNPLCAWCMVRSCEFNKNPKFK